MKKRRRWILTTVSSAQLSPFSSYYTQDDFLLMELDQESSALQFAIDLYPWWTMVYFWKHSQGRPPWSYILSGPTYHYAAKVKLDMTTGNFSSPNQILADVQDIILHISLTTLWTIQSPWVILSNFLSKSLMPYVSLPVKLVLLFSNGNVKKLKICR